MKGQKLLQVSAILLIVFYGLGILLGCFNIFTLIGIQSAMSVQSYGLQSYFAMPAYTWFAYIGSIIISIFGLTTGILGVVYCKQKQKAKICLAMGIVLMALIIISGVISIIYALSNQCTKYVYDILHNIYGSNYAYNSIDSIKLIAIITAFISLFVSLITPILYTVGASLFSKNDNIYPPYNNQYPPFNNGNNPNPPFINGSNNQNPPFNSNNNQYPNN